MPSSKALSSVLRDFHNHNDPNCAACQLIMDRVNEEELAYAVDDARREGWEAAREYFKNQTLDVIIQWRTSEQDFDIEEIFVNPEDADKILRDAALDSKGRP